MRDALSCIVFPNMTMIGLTIFFSFFMSMLIWVYRRQGRPMYQHLANLPLGDD